MDHICSHAHLCGKPDCPHYDPHDTTVAGDSYCLGSLHCEYIDKKTTCFPISDLRSQYVIIKQKEKNK